MKTKSIDIFFCLFAFDSHCFAMTNDENMPKSPFIFYWWLCWLAESNTNFKQILHKSLGKQQNILNASRKIVRCLSASDLILGVESILFKRNGVLATAIQTRSFCHSFKNFFCFSFQEQNLPFKSRLL